MTDNNNNNNNNTTQNWACPNAAQWREGPAGPEPVPYDEQGCAPGCGCTKVAYSATALRDHRPLVRVWPEGDLRATNEGLVWEAPSEPPVLIRVGAPPVRVAGGVLVTANPPDLGNELSLLAGGLGEAASPEQALAALADPATLAAVAAATTAYRENPFRLTEDETRAEASRLLRAVAALRLITGRAGLDCAAVDTAMEDADIGDALALVVAGEEDWLEEDPAVQACPWLLADARGRCVYCGCWRIDHTCTGCNVVY